MSFAFAGRLSRSLEGKSCMYSINMGSFSDYFLQLESIFTSSLHKKHRMGSTMLPRLPEKMETPFVLIRKGICLGTSRSSPPMALRQTCLQRHVIEMISNRSVLSGLLYFPVPGPVAVIPKTGYRKSRSGHVALV